MYLFVGRSYLSDNYGDMTDRNIWLHESVCPTEVKIMDINKTLKELKSLPGFTDHVGMMLIHNGVVRSWSRKDHATVGRVRVTPDRERMAAICHEMEQRPGIFKILADAAEGELAPGDDLLFLVVAGDIREHVKSTFAELLDRVKAEAVVKQEFAQ